MIVEPLDHTTNAREMWQFVPGSRRVRRAPSIEYDMPNPTFGQVATYDDAWMFNGAMDRFDWKLIGKKEIFVPYHNYQFDLAPADDLLAARHHNPQYLRWELHRVWVVEATLQSDKRHAYGKRVFYVDEDSWVGLLEDKYDNRGTLWRTALATTVMDYTLPVMSMRASLHYDFQSDRYCAHHLVNGIDKAIEHRPIDEKLFSPKQIHKFVNR